MPRPAVFRGVAATLGVVALLTAGDIARAGGSEEGEGEREGGQVSQARVTASLAGTLQWQRDPSQHTYLLVSRAGFELSDGFATSFSLGSVYDRPEDEPAAGGVSNVVPRVSYGRALAPPLTLNASLGVVVPLGSGGGNAADSNAHRAMLVATDWGGPMFAPNHLTLSPGAALQYDAGRVFTGLQSTLHQSFRVRGDKLDPIGSTLTFTTSSASLGLRPTASAEIFAQAAQTLYWTRPAFRREAGLSRADHYAGVGGATSFEVADGRALQSSLIYARALDHPKVERRYQLVQVKVGLRF